LTVAAQPHSAPSPDETAWLPCGCSGQRYRAWVQPAGRDLEVLVGRAEGVGGMDAAVNPTWRYSRRPMA
jgi:hypothetical protein